ncbi:phosphopantetheine-binding protein [Streptomyces sp. M19]
MAYVLPEPGEHPAQPELQKYVRDRLPRYMVPSTFAVLDAVPLTSTGKVDRARLPDPDPAAELPYAAPRTETERLLADIWSTVLKVDQVGVHHHFFDVGGESLRAMQAIAATNKLFRTRLSVRRLFDAPTIAEFAPVVDDARTTGREPPRPTGVRRRSRERPGMSVLTAADGGTRGDGGARAAPRGTAETAVPGRRCAGGDGGARLRSPPRSSGCGCCNGWSRTTRRTTSVPPSS